MYCLRHIVLVLLQGFAIDRNQPTLETIRPEFQSVIGVGTVLSAQDIRLANLMYGCNNPNVGKLTSCTAATTRTWVR